MELVSEQFAQRVLLGVAQVRSHLALSVPTIRAAIATLSDMQIVNELTGQRRHRVFAYLGYVLTHTIRMNIPATRLANSSSASTPAHLENFRYQHGFWARNLQVELGCRQPTWVPFMSGFGGILLVMFPNGAVWYSAADDGELASIDFARPAVELAKLENYCTLE